MLKVKKTFMKNYLILISILLAVVACAPQEKLAPIIYHHNNQITEINNNDDIEKVTTGNVNDGFTTIKPKEEQKKISNNTSKAALEDEYIFPEENIVAKQKKIIYHEVQPGEDIHNIALIYDQTPEEIARINKLTIPFKLENFQSLKIVVNNFYQPKTTNIKPSNEIRHKTSIKQEFIKPVAGKIITKFGAKTSIGDNKGINIKAENGTRVVASAGGKVIYADYDATFGNLVMIKLSDKNIITAYAHLEDVIIEKGYNIKQGDIIGYVGTSGKVKESQLHFSIREGKKAMASNLYTLI